ncbi:MAG: TIGR00159 family protein [Planctomycetes bacterium]|nr:TIGR00159 family protein [Planctomycetota bacterium]
MADLVETFLQMWRWQAVIEIPLMAIVIYYVLRFIEGTRMAGSVKLLVGFFTIGTLCVFKLGQLAHLNVIVWLVDKSLPIVAIALLFIFQPELRRGLIMLGRSPFFGLLTRGESATANEVFEAVTGLARSQTGALIAIQREVGMRGYIERGVRLDARVSAELLMSIFRVGTPLHDGAVIIQNNLIAAAGCLLPLTENIDIGVGMGTRHRAGIGVTEETDAICLIVSEETGGISVAMNGQIDRNIDRERLRGILREFYVEQGIAGDDITRKGTQS